MAAAALLIMMKQEGCHQAELPFHQETDFQTFKNWLLVRYTETPEHLHDVALVTGPYKDYNKLMEWYRYRYQKEKHQYDQMHNNNPFEKQEDTQ